MISRYSRTVLTLKATTSRKVSILLVENSPAAKTKVKIVVKFLTYIDLRDILSLCFHFLQLNIKISRTKGTVLSSFAKRSSTPKKLSLFHITVSLTLEGAKATGSISKLKTEHTLPLGFSLTSAPSINLFTSYFN